VFLGEFGATAACPGESRTVWIRDVLGLAREVGIDHTCYYTFKLPKADRAFALFSADAGSSLKNLLKDPQHKFVEADFDCLRLVRFVADDALRAVLGGKP